MAALRKPVQATRPRTKRSCSRHLRRDWTTRASIRRKSPTSRGMETSERKLRAAVKEPGGGEFEPGFSGAAPPNGVDNLVALLPELEHLLDQFRQDPEDRRP